MKTRMLLAVLALSSFSAFAGPRFAGGGGEGKGAKFEERFEEKQKEFHLKAVVAISEALGLNEAESVKLSEKLKGFEAQRAPLRIEMFKAMKAVKDAADGDAAAQANIDANVQKVLDGRTQLAALDKELYNSLAQGQTAQKKAKLAMALGQLSREGHGGFGKKGRHHRMNAQPTAR